MTPLQLSVAENMPASSNASQNYLIICPGIHSSDLTRSLLTEIDAFLPPLPLQILLCPQVGIWSFSPFFTLQFLQQQIRQPHQANLIFLGFSAGVVAAMGAALAWHYHRGGRVEAVIAVDGWGVALAAEFPVYRLSHDYFTHWSSALLGKGSRSFYADPSVSHHQLWRSPSQVTGWQTESDNLGIEQRSTATAATFLTQLLQRHSH